jgi:hypothetical protein
LTFDLRAITLSLFLPMLYWTGTVIAISLFGYPGVVCVTPLAWLLALPIGLRMALESKSPLEHVLVESAAAGALLGLWQGLLAAAVLAAVPLLAVRPLAGSLNLEALSPLLAALVGGLVSMPITAGLAAATTWVRRRQGVSPQ